ncbi:hypothetical protein E3U43_020524 [Larimichthys crocea]|uniref:Uncharacterized protein n=1 Tax=Larimichthys crocea TaxID=215358 RepID=A0ACD3Q6H2_LARCR|nr:hypothetical protein E3U43_020524 [Larimichthys crocea]
MGTDSVSLEPWLLILLKSQPLPGLTCPRCMGSGLKGYRTMSPLKPQLMVLLVQDTWALVLVVTEPWVLVQLMPEPQPVVYDMVLMVTESWVSSQSHDHCFYESRAVAPGPDLVLPEPEPPWLLVVQVKNHSSTKTDGTSESRTC